MKNRVTKLKVRWRARKTIFWCTSTIVIGLITSILFSMWFSKFTEKLWIYISIITTIIFGSILFLITYIAIYVKAKKQIYYVNLKKKTISLDRKTTKYDVVYIRDETVFQKLFKLITLEFVNERELIVMKDVSKEVLEYIETV